MSQRHEKWPLQGAATKFYEQAIFHKIASFQRQPTVFKSAMNILRKPVPPDLQHLFKNPDGPIVQLGMSFQAYILQPLTLTGLMVGNGQLSGTLGQDLRQLSQTTDMQMNTLLWGVYNCGYGKKVLAMSTDKEEEETPNWRILRLVPIMISRFWKNQDARS
ncbi:uncharacterized protein LOC144763893 isoform X2 [Lissotriton helveticus]